VQGSRALGAASCESLARATALIVALAIDPEAVSTVAEAPLPAPVVVPPPPPPPKPPPRRREATRVDATVTSGVALEQALMPRLALGAFVGGGLDVRWLRADLMLGFWPYASARFAAPPGAGIEFTLVAAAVQGCSRVLPGRLLLYACTGLRGNAIRARGFGVTENGARTTTLLGVTAGVLGSFAMGRAWSLEAGLDGVIPLERPSFAIENVGTAYRPGPIGAAARAGVRARF